MNSTALETSPAPMSGWKRFGLSAILVPLALFETWDSSMFFVALDGLSDTGSGLSGALKKIYILTHPVFALAALICALAGRVRWAVAAMAGVVLGRWLWYLPGPNGSLASKDLYVLAQPTIMLLVIPPVLAAFALVLARRNQHPGLAVLLVSVPVIYSNYEMALFILAVSIYGF
ncbi:MAG: hypothetical protein EKK40_12180 [Bradyrhizobiaceae bacterium]|nr:MAG: hypothetical protein EKK40_12180 [Bradyrhizobiaceae bacterium]